MDAKVQVANHGRFVLGIPQMPPGENYHPGGQLTAANGLVEYLSRQGLAHDVLNTVATVFPPVPLWKKLLQSAARIGKASVLAMKPDVVGYLAFSGFGLSLYERCCIALIFKWHRKPSVIFFRSSEIIGKPMSVFKQNLLSRILATPSAVVSQGSLLARELERFGRNSVEVIPNWLPPGYAIARQPKTYPADGVVDFVFVGWLERKKGVPELIEAAAQLQSLAGRFRLHLVGNGNLESEVSEMIADRALHNVIAHGWLEKDEVIRLLDRAHVFVLPSHSEGFPNAMLEAIAHGLPVIATKVGGIPDSITDGTNGMLVDLEDCDGIAGCIRRYIEEPALIPAHSLQAIEKVRHAHDRDVNCGRLIHLLEVHAHEKNTRTLPQG